MKASHAVLVPGLWLVVAGHASAGMTVVTLNDVAAARIDALSFFLFTYLAITWMVKIIWNQLAKTFALLPKLRYREALGVVFVTGLMFYVVLTMISGARELLTPGAWEKQGTGYRLREGEPVPVGKEERQLAMRNLRDAIWKYARAQQGEAPGGPLAEGIATELWEYQGGGLYCQVPGVKPGGGREVLVYEPSAAGGRRLVLLADGSLEDRSEGVLESQLDQQIQR